ncbi:MAG: transcriptional regulator [Spirochaetales bacterium]|nr:transcriptional regulator [Spirochaetales bacterium]
MENINPVIHQPTRLKIMAALVSLNDGAKVDFNFLSDLLSLSDGNLSIHLQKLEKEKLIVVKKEFVGRRPKTWVWASKQGRKAFEEYVANMEKILKGNEI